MYAWSLTRALGGGRSWVDPVRSLLSMSARVRAPRDESERRMNSKTPFVVSLTLIASLAAVSCAAETPAAKEPGYGGKTATTKGPSCDPKVGALAPKLEIQSMNGGGKVSIAPGKVTLVDFWATWCEPCKDSFPKYQELYAKYKSKGLEVIAVSGDEEDTKKEIPGFVKKYGAKFPVGWDQGHPIAECWKPTGNPSAYIIDKKGVVRHIHTTWHAGDEKKIEEQIKALL
jgi:cytochrome c biogenesis protein CcmG/thiol:disulfide interchange protein DsbE